MKPIYEKVNKPEDQSFYIEEVNKPYFTDQWHFHPEIEILYVREGYGIKYVGDSINSFCPGDVVIIGSNTPHTWSCNSDYLSPANKLRSKAVCIQFMSDFLGKPSVSLPELHVINEFLIETQRGIEFINATGKILAGLIDQLPSQTGMTKLVGLLTILDLMSKSSDMKYLSTPDYKPKIINSEDRERMMTIFQYVTRNYPSKISLEEIAEKVNLTPPSFCRYFKSRTTKVFSSFVNEVRISNSCKMLIENKIPISQVCFESGFNYLSNFNRQFRKIKGITPSEFQRRYKLNDSEILSDESTN